MRKASYVLALVIFVILFIRPYPTQLLGKLGVRAADFAMLVLVLLPPTLARDIRADTKVLACGAALLALSALAFLSSFLGIANGLSLPDIRDIFESLRYVGLIPYILFGFFLGRHEKFSPRTLVILMTAVLIATVVFCLFQKFDPIGTLPLTSWYSPEHQVGRSSKTARVMAFFSNPNTNGLMILNLLLAPLIYTLVRAPTWRWLLISAILTLLSLYSIVLTGSRTSFVTLLGVGVGVSLLMQRVRLIGTVAFTIAMLFFFRDPVIGFMQSQSAYFANGVRNILYLDITTILTQGTFARRMDHWREALQFFEASPLIGAGPLRARIGSATDNFYIYLLARYGILGLGIFGSLWVWIFAWCYRGTRSADRDTRYLAFYVSALVISICIANISIEAQIIPSSAALFFTFVGTYLGRLHRTGRREEIQFAS